MAELDKLYLQLKKWTCNHMDEPQKNYAEWKKPDQKEYRVYDSIYLIF